jgi:hypothetical protein
MIVTLLELQLYWHVSVQRDVDYSAAYLQLLLALLGVQQRVGSIDSGLQRGRARRAHGGLHNLEVLVEVLYR